MTLTEFAPRGRFPIVKVITLSLTASDYRKPTKRVGSPWWALGDGVSPNTKKTIAVWARVGHIVGNKTPCGHVNRFKRTLAIGTTGDDLNLYELNLLFRIFPKPGNDLLLFR